MAGPSHPGQQGTRSLRGLAAQKPVWAVDKGTAIPPKPALRFDPMANLQSCFLRLRKGALEG